MNAPAIRRRAVGLIVPVLVLIAWEYAARGASAPDYLAAPTAIAVAFVTLLRDGTLWANLDVSVWRVFAGFALGTVSGAAVGMIVGTWRAAAAYVNPLVSITYPLPKIAFLPIIVIWLGLGDVSKIVTIAFSVFFPTFINAYGGANDLNERYIWAAQSMGASRLRIFAHVIFPATLPQIFTGARVGLGLAYVTLFATELFGANSGLGYLITMAQSSHRFDVMYVAILTIGIAGFLSDRAILWLRGRLVRGVTFQENETPDA